jgi:pyridine nucleotide-disulfide oxidoreductase family protein
MKHLVMIGAGHAHVHLLSTLAGQPLAGVQITLIAPSPRQLYSGMVPGFVAGHYALEDCVIPMEPLLKNTEVTWLQRSATGLDTNARVVTLDDGSTVAYDVLSINSGAVQDRQKIELMMPGAREHALFLRPIESFGALWPQVVAMGEKNPLRLAVMGGGAAGFELACAMSHRLPTSSVTLLSSDLTVGSNYPPAVQALMRQTLRARHINVIQEHCAGIAKSELTLANGARLVCDVPIIATDAQAPAWLQNSGLALDDQGFVSVNALQHSTSHPGVFAASDVATRVDLMLPRSGVYAVHAGVPLSNNLRACLAGVAPSPYTPQDKTLNLLSCGDRRAIASWGTWSAQGRWVWWLKNWIDRSFVKKYSKSHKAAD